MQSARSAVLAAAATAAANIRQSGVSKTALVVATTPGLVVPRPTQSFRPRADAADPVKALADLSKAFADFKAANDEALKGKADAVAVEKVNKINDAVGELQKSFDEMSQKLAAAMLNGAANGNRKDTPERRAYTDAFNSFFRSGAGSDTLKSLAVKAQLTRQSDPDGGYVVSPEMEAAIDRVLSTVSSMRQLARVQTTGAAVYKKRVGLGGATSGWVGEEETRTETDTPRIAQLEFPAMTIYAEPEATEEMLEDADMDVAQWLADEIDIVFAEQEGSAFISGNGVKKPRGLLAYDTVADDNWVWGKLGFVVSGDAATLTTPDPLIDITEALKQGFRPNASWLMNRKTNALARKLKNGEGEYIWQPSLELGKPANLLGYPTYSDDYMDSVGANKFPIAFGDFRRGYLILDRRGIKVLRNPYKNSGFVTFYTTKRVGGGVQHFEAIKLLKCSA